MSYPKHFEGAAVLQETRGFNLIFIHSSLDDAGLTPQEFRLFAHLSRRAGEGIAFAAAASMSAACRMHPDTIWTALRELERRGMIVRERRQGQTNVIRIAAPSEWDLNPPKKEPTPSNRVTGNEGVTPTRFEGVPPPGLKGCEGNPLKQSNEGRPVPAPSASGEQPLTGKPASGSDLKLNHPAKPEPPLSAAPSFHKQFTEAWCNAYKTDRGESYLFVGGRDGSAVKRLAATGLSVGDLVALARRAWKARGREFFWCEKAVTIGAFASRLNEIRAELAAPSRRTLPPSMRVATPAELARDAAEEF